MENSLIISEAKKLITRYLNEEFRASSGYSIGDLGDIGLAYTTLEEAPYIEISATADLENFEIRRYLNGILFHKITFNSPADFIQFLPELLDFDYLTGISHIPENTIALLLERSYITSSEAEVLHDRFK